MSGTLIVAGHSLRSALRGRALAVVALFVAVFLLLYAYGAAELIPAAPAPSAEGFEVEERAVVATLLLSLGAFVALFTGLVLAVSMTMGAVRGDADRGLLQPLVVRPVGRSSLLAGRLAAAALVACGFAATTLIGVLVLTDAVGGYRSEGSLAAVAGVTAAVLVVVGLSLLASTLLGPAGSAVAVLLMFALGLAGGVLDQVGGLFDSAGVERTGKALTWILPFQALYQDSLAELGRSGEGLSVSLGLGPLGAPRSAANALWAWAAAYAAILFAAALARIRTLDL